MKNFRIFLFDFLTGKEVFAFGGQKFVEGLIQTQFESGLLVVDVRPFEFMG